MARTAMAELNQDAVTTHSPGSCRRRGEPFPLSPRLEGADPPTGRPPAKGAHSHQGNIYQTPQHRRKRRHRPTTGHPQSHHLPAAQDGAPKEDATLERRRRPIEDLGFSP